MNEPSSLFNPNLIQLKPMNINYKLYTTTTKPSPNDPSVKEVHTDATMRASQPVIHMDQHGEVKTEKTINATEE